MKTRISISLDFDFEFNSHTYEVVNLSTHQKVKLINNLADFGTYYVIKVTNGFVLLDPTETTLYELS